MPPTNEAPSQVRHAGRSATRTFVQTIIPAIITLGVVVPLIVDAVVDQTGEILSPKVRGILLAVSAGVAGAAALVARIMAIPAVEAFLRKHSTSQWLAAEPTPVPPRDVEPEYEPRHDYDEGDYNPGGVVR